MTQYCLLPRNRLLHVAVRAAMVSADDDVRFLRLNDDTLRVGDILVINTRFSGTYYHFLRVHSFTRTRRPRVCRLSAESEEIWSTPTICQVSVRPTTPLVDESAPKALSADGERYLKYRPLSDYKSHYVERYDPERTYENVAYH